MVRTASPTWRAPSVASLSSQNIRLDCDPETVRAVWRATTNTELRLACIAACDNDLDKGDDLYHDTRIERGAIVSFHAHKRILINRLAGFHGVEYLGLNRKTGKCVRYCNAGDTYAPTLVFHGRTLSVGTWGDLVERRTVQPERED